MSGWTKKFLGIDLSRRPIYVSRNRC